MGQNLKWLLQDNRGGELGLAPLNGLRVLMMAWIILGHTFTCIFLALHCWDIKFDKEEILQYR